MNKFTRLALLGLVVSIASVSTLRAGGGCGDGDKKDKKESSEGDKKE